MSWLPFHHEFLELNSGFHAWWQALLPAFESQGFEREQLLDRMRPSKAMSLLLLGIFNRMGNQLDIPILIKIILKSYQSDQTI